MIVDISGECQFSVSTEEQLRGSKKSEPSIGKGSFIYTGWGRKPTQFLITLVNHLIYASHNILIRNENI